MIKDDIITFGNYRWRVLSLGQLLPAILYLLHDVLPKNFSVSGILPQGLLLQTHLFYAICYIWI